MLSKRRRLTSNTPSDYCLSVRMRQQKSGDISYTLRSETKTYFVGQPFRLTLHVKNLSQSKRILPPVLNAGYRIGVRGPGDSEHHQVFGVLEVEENRDLLPGASRAIELPRSLRDRCFTPGTNELQYCYFGTQSKGGPKWVTPPITITCLEQPLVIPKGTDERVKAALRKLKDSPKVGISSGRPGWTAVSYTEPMKQLSALGKLAVPALLANVNNYAIGMPIIQLLGDMKVKQAVPLLLDRLWMQDGPHDSLIIATLAEITEHPDGYRFHRHWFDKKTQEAAVRAYRDWWVKYEKAPCDQNTQPKGR